jgi:hypothetical protein
MMTSQEHAIRVLKERVAAHKALDELLSAAAGDLDPYADAVLTARRRKEAADYAYVTDLEGRGFSAPYGLRRAA